MFSRSGRHDAAGGIEPEKKIEGRWFALGRHSCLDFGIA
jgi:hypothetical protein